MKKTSYLLIADRNPNVREFLKREMTAQGYQVRLAVSYKEISNFLVNNEYPDLLILDPNLPDIDENHIKNNNFNFPIVIHTISNEIPLFKSSNIAAYVEKKGNSIENLKQIVGNILNRH